MAQGPEQWGLIERGVRLPPRQGARASQLIEHPAEIPLRVRSLSRSGPRLEDPGLGGIRFTAPRAIPPGTFVELTTQVGGAPIALEGMIIAWTRRRGETRLAMAFMDHRTAFEGRMYEQACHIEAYRLRNAARGRALTTDQAAEEWINRYSAAFPGLACSP